MTKKGLNLNLFTLLLVPLVLAASLVLGANGDVVRIRADSPLQYEVVKGDTLWDISGHFLEDPWLWPEVWEDNPQIDNPHLIYPGDVVLLVYIDGKPRLTVRRSLDLPVLKLSPEVKRGPLFSPIDLIYFEDIEAFLSENRVAGVEEIENSPILVGTQAGEFYSAEDDIVYAYGSWDTAERYYDIVRPEREVKDRETGKVIGIEAIIIGLATRTKLDGEKGTLVITESREEITNGDHFLPRKRVKFEPDFFPIPPSFEVDSVIVDIEFGESYGGSKDTVIVDVGDRDGIESGHLLTMIKADHVVKHESENLHFTGEKFGYVLIYQVFKDFSLGLVLNSELPVETNDRVVAR